MASLLPPPAALRRFPCGSGKKYKNCCGRNA
ncbi:MAG: SEC-C metal-binding domain-containing protein [Oscillospiraceae bacterium]